MRAMETITLQCPRCFERFEVQLEVDVNGRMVCDCEVCCAPLELEVHHDSGDEPRVTVQPAND